MILNRVGEFNTHIIFHCIHFIWYHTHTTILEHSNTYNRAHTHGWCLFMHGVKHVRWALNRQQRVTPFILRKLQLNIIGEMRCRFIYGLTERDNCISTGPSYSRIWLDYHILSAVWKLWKIHRKRWFKFNIVLDVIVVHGNTMENKQHRPWVVLCSYAEHFEIMKRESDVFLVSNIDNSEKCVDIFWYTLNSLLCIFRMWK